jgi:hypothetical protein
VPDELTGLRTGTDPARKSNLLSLQAEENSSQAELRSLIGKISDYRLVAEASGMDSVRLLLISLAAG